MTLEPLLEINDLCLEYRQNDLTIPVLDQVSLSLAPGKTLGLIGESGCGKTSLAMAIMGLAQSARITGDIRFNGVELTGLKEKKLAKFRWNRIALVFQNSQEVFNPVITMGEQVAETLIRHLGLDRAAASQQTARLFKQAGLEPVWQNAYAHQFSGGMRQRVLIAMAVACSPDLLIVDEPPKLHLFCIPPHICHHRTNLCLWQRNLIWMKPCSTPYAKPAATHGRWPA